MSNNQQLPLDRLIKKYNEDYLEQLIEKHPRGYREGEGWNISLLSKNPFISMSFIRKHINGLYAKNEAGELVLTPWNWYIVSMRDDFDQNLVREFPDNNYNCSHLSTREDFDESLLLEFPDKSWNIKAISFKKNLDFSVVRKLFHKNWHCRALSSSDNLDFDLVKKFPDEDWCYYTFSMRPDLPRWLPDLLPHKFGRFPILNTPVDKLDLEKMSVETLSMMYFMKGE